MQWHLRAGARSLAVARARRPPRTLLACREYDRRVRGEGRFTFVLFNDTANWLSQFGGAAPLQKQLAVTRRRTNWIAGSTLSYGAQGRGHWIRRGACERRPGFICWRFSCLRQGYDLALGAGSIWCLP